MSYNEATEGGGVYVQSGGTFRFGNGSGTVYGNVANGAPAEKANTATNGAALYKETDATAIYNNTGVPENPTWAYSTNIPMNPDGITKDDTIDYEYLK